MAEGRVRRFIPEDLSNVEFETSEEVQVVPTFDGMGLREDLLRGIYAYGNYGGCGGEVLGREAFCPRGVCLHPLSPVTCFFYI